MYNVWHNVLNLERWLSALQIGLERNKDKPNLDSDDVVVQAGCRCRRRLTVCAQCAAMEMSKN